MKSKLIDVRIIQAKGESALVEWVADGIPYRAFVPLIEIITDQASEETLKAGIPYGVDWENVALVASAATLAINLRRNGIWTGEDLRLNLQAALGCIQATYGVDLAKLAEYAGKKKEGN